MDDLIVFLIYMTAIFAVFTVCGIGTDCVLPHIEPLNRWIDSLPMMEDEDDFL